MINRLLPGIFFLCATLAVSAPALRAQEQGVSGSWKGTFTNSLGEKGDTAVELIEHGDGTLTGTWEKLKIEKGERVTASVVQWECRDGGRRYNLRGTIKDGGKGLTVEYTVTYKEDGKIKGYTGTLALTK